MWDLLGPGIKSVSLVLQGIFLTTGPPWKSLNFFKCQCELRIYKKVGKHIIVLNLRSWIHVSLIFCVMKWDIHILIYNGHFKEKKLCDSLSCPPTVLAIFTWKKWLTMAMKTWAFGRHFPENKVSYHFKENSWQYLLPLTKPELLSKFGKLVSVIMNLTAF